MTGVGALGLAVAALAGALAMVAVVRHWAVHHGFLDIPSPRSSHLTPTPRGGGIGIVIATAASWWAYVVVSAPARVERLGWLLLAALLVAIVSFTDDLRSLPYQVRLAVHGAAGLVVLAVLPGWEAMTLPLVGTVHPGWFGAALALLWVVGLTNAYNFMDGIDGLAGGQGVLAGLGWFAAGWVTHTPAVAALGLVLAASCAGFLWYNWAPARIFMGDVGSAFLGFCFASLPLLHTHLTVARGDGPIGFLVGALLLWPFLFDTVYTVIRRAIRGERLVAPHRSHLYQRLVVAGASHAQVTLEYLTLSAIGAGLAVLRIARPSTLTDLAVVVIPLALGMALRRQVARRERTATAG